MAENVDFKGLIAKKVLIADGAMGTMLYAKGVFLNSCFDELNLTNPLLIKDIHTAYIKAGADIIETNSFGANEYKLAKFGLAPQTEEINRQAVKIAKSAANPQTLIAGAIGPLGCEVAKYARITPKTAFSLFQQQASALASEGADLLILETFSSTDELLTAIDAASTTNLPIIAQLTVNDHSETPYGERIESAIARIAEIDAVTAVGLNCSVGPSAMLENLEQIRKVTQKPLSVQPNAGLPRNVDNRTLYMCTPEYMAEYSKRFFEKGARIIGGCCGTTPEHIRQIANAVHALDKAQGKSTFTHITIQDPTQKAKPAGCDPIPLENRSKIGKKLVSGEKITTIEVTPPLGTDLNATIEKAKHCADLGIDAINIPDGPRASSRLSPMITAIKIQQNAALETILHFCCRDRNIIGMQSDMLGASAIGINNILAITGDPPKLGQYPDATGVFDIDSIALTKLICDLNRGLDLAGNTFTPPTLLTVSVGANPVSTDLEREIERFKSKVKAGAEYAITQPVFDVNMLFEFMDAIDEYKIPIIAGIWPFTSFKNAEFMANEVPGVVVPNELLAKMSSAKTKEQGRSLGIEIAREMIEKISDRVAGYAVSAPFGNVKIALAALDRLDISEV